jgi:CheY-like chemotaxis protein
VQKIVFVEDDEAFAYAATKALEQAGFVVYAASGSLKAMSILEEQRPDLLVTDVRFPAGQPHGLAFARLAQYRHAQLRVLYLTAYPELISLDGPNPVGRVLYKPIDVETLVSEVRAQMTLPDTRAPKA